MEKKLFLIGILMILFRSRFLMLRGRILNCSFHLRMHRFMPLSITRWSFLQRWMLRLHVLLLKEMITNALPQIDASGSFNDNLKLMTTLLPGDFFGKPGEKVPVTFGSQFNSGATLQASLLLVQCSCLYWH